MFNWTAATILSAADAGIVEIVTLFNATYAHIVATATPSQGVYQRTFNLVALALNAREEAIRESKVENLLATLGIGVHTHDLAWFGPGDEPSCQACHDAGHEDESCTICSCVGQGAI